MPSFGAAELLVLLMFVVLVLDSRRLHTLARAGGRSREVTAGIPAGAEPDRVGLTLRHIQMRHHIDWQDGGIGWDGPEILPADEPDDELVDEVVDAEPEAGPGRLPVLWKPFAALPAAGATGRWLQPPSTTSSPTEMRPPVTTAA